MTVFACFGYGSLVNARTLAAGTQVRPARVSGWRRAWRLAGEASFGRRCTLTVVPDRDSSILGVMLLQPLEHREALSRREAHYDPVPIEPATIEWLDGDGAWADAFIHVGRPEHVRTGDADHPVMLSYVDVVIAGFRERYGDAGALNFVETTLDWHVPVLNDRARPRYPRAVPVSAGDRLFVDRLLAELASPVIADDDEYPDQTPATVSATR